VNFIIINYPNFYVSFYCFKVSLIDTTNKNLSIPKISFQNTYLKSFKSLILLNMKKVVICLIWVKL